MINSVISEILNELHKSLDIKQLKTVGLTLSLVLSRYEIKESDSTVKKISNDEIITDFIAAKKIEGCSSKTLKYYISTITKAVSEISKPIVLIDTDDLRKYLTAYQENGSCCKVTMDNIRRILSSFFTWLEDEDLIIKSPIRRIKKVKTGQTVKDTFSDEELESLRDAVNNKRDRALIDLLSSTGMRIGELINLNKNDVDLINRECKVFGKGDSERIVYFDARAKLHLNEYLMSRTDSDPALFVSLNFPNKRISINSVESRLKIIGKAAKVNDVYPHKFRRTMATHAIDKGMPIEQVQKLLGHVRIDTTMHYAMVNQGNVKISHKKFLC